jgi:hypothetical protein
MRLRVTLVSVLALLVLVSAVPLCAENNQAVENSLKTNEHAGWQSWKDKDPKAFQDMIPDDVVNIADGMMQHGKQQILKDLSAGTCTVNSFSLSDFSFQWIDKDAVMLTYTATQDATCNGKKQPGKVIASSLWVKKGGKWLSPFHQETTADGM